MKKRIFFATIAFMWCGALPAYAQTGRPLERVTIAQVADFFLYAPLYVAADSGYFTGAGLDVRIVNTGSDDKTWAAVISGSAQFGVGDPSFVALSDARGLPGRVIANVVNGVPFWGVTYRRDISPFQQPIELKTHSVATFPAPSTAYTLQRQMFESAGLTPNIREGAFGALLTMAKAGRADIALELEPNVSQAVQEQATVLYSLADLYGDFAITGLIANPTYLDAAPNTAQGVVCSLQRALDFMRNDPEQALAILSKRFPDIKPDVARMAFNRVVQAGIVPKGVTTSPAAWDKALKLRLQSGDLKEAKGFDTYVDNRYAAAAMENPACRLGR